MQPLAALRDGGKAFFAKDRDQEVAAIKRQKACDAEDQERSGKQPMAKAFKAGEAQDGTARLFPVNTDAAPDQEEQNDDGDHSTKDIGSVFPQGTGAEGQPPHAAILNQNPGGRALGRYGHICRAITQGAVNVAVGSDATCAELAQQTFDIALPGVVRAIAVVDLLAALAGKDVFEGRCPRRFPPFRVRRCCHRSFGQQPKRPAQR